MDIHTKNQPTNKTFPSKRFNPINLITQILKSVHSFIFLEKLQLKLTLKSCKKYLLE